MRCACAGPLGVVSADGDDRGRCCVWGVVSVAFVGGMAVVGRSVVRSSSGALMLNLDVFRTSKKILLKRFFYIFIFLTITLQNLFLP